MHEPEKASLNLSLEDFQSFTFEVRAEASHYSPELDTVEFATLPSLSRDEQLITEPSRIQESPDDLFAVRFGVAPRTPTSFDPQVASFLDLALIRVISEALFDMDSAEPQGLSIRRGGSGSVSSDMSVRWISYTETQTESSLLPDFNAIQVLASAESPQTEVEIQGVERFSSGEARVLMIGEGEEVALGVFVLAACRAEAIEHFIRAVAGSGEPSFLYNALEQEVVRRLDGDTPVGSKDYNDVLIWIRASLAWSVVSLDSAISCTLAAESIVLKLRMADPDSDVFVESFGSPTLTCKVTFGNPDGALVERPTFEWL